MRFRDHGIEAKSNWIIDTTIKSNSRAADLIGGARYTLRASGCMVGCRVRAKEEVGNRAGR